MSNKRQTAVEWLIEKLNHLNIQKSLYKPIDFRIKKQEIIDQAKEKERKQKMDAFIAGMEFIPVDPNRYQEDAEQYYTETYNTPQP
jgi:hypothetical protein